MQTHYARAHTEATQRECESVRPLIGQSFSNGTNPRDGIQVHGNNTHPRSFTYVTSFSNGTNPRDSIRVHGKNTQPRSFTYVTSFSNGTNARDSIRVHGKNTQPRSFTYVTQEAALKSNTSS